MYALLHLSLPPRRSADNTVDLQVLAVCIYRLTLHPYAKYPGPFLAKLTNAYSAYHAWKGDIHIDMHLCHEKYGTSTSVMCLFLGRFISCHNQINC